MAFCYLQLLEKTRRMQLAPLLLGYTALFGMSAFLVFGEMETRTALQRFNTVRQWFGIIGFLLSALLWPLFYSNKQSFTAGSRYFCESFFGHPCPTGGKNYAAANAFGGPSRPASLVAYPTRGMQHSYAMTRRDFERPAFSLRKKRFVKTHALSLLGATRLLSRSEGTGEWDIQITSHEVAWKSPEGIGEESFKIKISEISKVISENSNNIDSPLLFH